MSILCATKICLDGFASRSRLPLPAPKGFPDKTNKKAVQEIIPTPHIYTHKFSSGLVKLNIIRYNRTRRSNAVV
jgi:hypothetical protein